MRNIQHTQKDDWVIPSAKVRLTENEVHIWRASLNVSSMIVTACQDILCDEEVWRAKKFLFEKDRQHWIVARGILRQLLGCYLDTDPREVDFTTNEHGKPFIKYPTHAVHLHFNVSHSADLALYAFSYGRSIGVDVEYMRPNVDYEVVVHSRFSAYERATLQALPGAVQREAFFLCWSRKEAYVKARGKGLAIPLSQFDVSLTPGEPAALLSSREDLEATRNWSLQGLSPGRRYAGAVVVEGTNWQLSCWQWF